MIGLVIGVPAVSSSIGMPDAVETIIGLTRWPLLAVTVGLILAVLYRWAPDRDAAKWRWVSPGALVSTILWLAGSALFSLYIENFNSVSKTYGPFSAVVTLMLWLFLTAYIILLGAEIKSESEMQTERDSTHGPSEPMGERGAYAADHVADGDEEPADEEKNPQNP
jgi:membrane protein